MSTSGLTGGICSHAAMAQGVRLTAMIVILDSDRIQIRDCRSVATGRAG